MDQSFVEELAIAMAGGMVAALGGGAAVYTGLASAEQKRDVRNRILDQVIDAHLVLVAETSVAALHAERGSHSDALDTLDSTIHGSPVSEFRSFNDTPGNFLRLAIRRIEAASKFAVRASRFDSWVLKRLYKRADVAIQNNEPANAALQIVAAKLFIERRLRSPRLFSPFYITAAISSRVQLRTYAKQAVVWEGADIKTIRTEYNNLPQPALQRSVSLRDADTRT